MSMKFNIKDVKCIKESEEFSRLASIVRSANHIKSRECFLFERNSIKFQMKFIMTCESFEWSEGIKLCNYSSPEINLNAKVDKGEILSALYNGLKKVQDTYNIDMIYSLGFWDKDCLGDFINNSSINYQVKDL